MRWNPLLLFGLLPSVCLLLSGCPKPVPPGEALDDDEVAEAPPPPPRVPAAAEPVDANPCSVLSVRFDYDSAVLSPATQAALVENAECIRRNGFATVTIEGHCCELGSTEYNLALGQRRADVVLRYLVDLGLDPRALRSISYGEERPVATGASGDAMASNRRAEFDCGGGDR